MTIDLYTTEKGGKSSLIHDLNFQKDRYEAKHVISFKNPSSALLNILRETGPIPGEENGSSKKRSEGEKKRKKVPPTVDMEKLADLLVKLGEDDLLQVVQMIHDNKSEDTYTKNDVDRKSFHSLLRVCLLMIRRGRIPRRSLHPPRDLGQDALGLRLESFSRIIVRILRSSPDLGTN